MKDQQKLVLQHLVEKLTKKKQQQKNLTPTNSQIIKIPL